MDNNTGSIITDSMDNTTDGNAAKVLHCIKNPNIGLNKSVKASKIARVVAMMLVVSIVLAVFAVASDFTMAYEVKVDGETVGYMQSAQKVEQAKNAVESYASKILGREYKLQNEVSSSFTLLNKSSSNGPEAVVAALMSDVTQITDMYVLSVDGVAVAGSQSEEELKETLAFVLDQYTRGDEIKDVSFLNDIEIKYQPADRELIGKASKLMNAKTSPFKVEATYKRSSLADIKREQKIVYDKSKYLDYESTVSGSDGVSEVFETYTLINGVEESTKQLNTVVLKPATDDIITKGTKAIPTTRPTGTYINPVAGGKFTSDYGRRGRYENHTGIDIANASNTEIVASDSGRVVYSQWKGNYGNYVIIEHSNGVETRYAHLRKYAVKKGDMVTQGQTIGYMGSTGRSTGTHLHFEVLKNGTLQDPKNYIDINIYEDYR